MTGTPGASRPEPTRFLHDGLIYYDPTERTGDLFVWDDGVHIVNEVKLVPGGIQYILACGQLFTFASNTNRPIKPLEIELELPIEPICKNCLP